jgi:hypothetical protein
VALVAEVGELIFAIWRNWIERGQWWWLALLCAVVLTDIFVGSWIISKELQLLKEVMR